jgi:tetratricopeptide (TPR) repeat protein
MQSWTIGAVIGLCLLGAAPALAQTPAADLQAAFAGCDSPTKHRLTNDQRLGVCNTAIASKAYQGKDLATLYLDRWIVLNAKHEPAAAEADLQTALATWPDIATDAASISVAYMQRKKYDLAKTGLDAAAKAQPGNARVHYALAQWHLHQGEYDLAALDNDKAVSAEPNNTDTLQQQATLHALRGDTGGAIAIIDNLVAQYPANAIFLNYRCYLRGTLGRDIDKALADCNAALKIAPQNPDILDSRGLVYLRLSRWADAIADYNEAIRRDDHPSPTSFYGRGLAEQQSGNRVSATADFSAALALSPGIDKKFGTVAMLAE